MLLRCMMILFLLMIFISPAWANEKDVLPTKMASEQMTMEDALSKITIKAEDWLDGDTYYIRYTFANPTDVGIEKMVDYTDIQFTTYPATDPSDTKIPHYCPTDIHQYSDCISTLEIPSQSSSLITVSFPRKIDSPMILPKITTFYFTDQTALSCEREKQAAFAISSLVGKEGDTANLLVKNTSFDTITEIKDVAVYSELRKSTDRTQKIRFHTVETDSISLELKQNEQTLLSSPNMPTLSNDKYLQDTSITMTINGVPHQFNIYYGGRVVDAFSYSNAWMPVFLSDHWSPVFAVDEDFVQSDCSYEIEDSTVHVYLRIKNSHTHPIYLKKPDISASFNYYDLHDISLHDRFLSSNCDTSRISLPPLHLNAGAEKFFTFSFKLPDDFKKMRGNLRVYCSDFGVSSVLDVRSSVGYAVCKALSSLQKVVYTDLGMVLLD